MLRSVMNNKLFQKLKVPHKIYLKFEHNLSQIMFLKKSNQSLELFWRKGVLKNKYSESESCQVKFPGKILEKIPTKKIIFSKVAGF